MLISKDTSYHSNSDKSRGVKCGGHYIMADVEDILCGPENREPSEDIVDLLYKGCFNNGLHTFMVKTDTNARISYKELFQKSVSLAHFFHAFGARSDQVVAIFTNDSIAGDVSILATFYVGATAAIISTDFSLEEVIQILLITNPCLIYSDFEGLDKIKEALLALNRRVKIITPRGMDPNIDFFSLLEFESTGYKMNIPSEPNKHALVILLIRGSTGKHRSVLLTNNTIKKWVYGIKDNWQTNGLTLLIKSQTTTITGLCFFLAAILGCSTLVNASGYSTEDLIRAICDFEVNFAYMPPEILLALADFPILAHYDLCKLKQIATSGSYLTANQQLYLIDKLCQSRIPLTQSYGFSDTGLLVVDPSGQTKFGSPGKQRGIQFVKVVDRDSEYYGTLQSNTSRYAEEWSCPAGLLVDSNEWMYMGEMMVHSDVGWIFVVKRIVKTFTKNKEKQAEFENVEDIFPIKYPAAFEIAVVGKPNAVGGDRPLAFVSQLEGTHLLGQDLMMYLLARVTNNAKSSYGVNLVDIVPKLPSAKVLQRLSKLQV